MALKSRYREKRMISPEVGGLVMIDEVDIPKTNAFVNICIESKIVDGKPVICYKTTGDYDGSKNQEYTDRNEFVKYIESRLEVESKELI